MSKLLLYIFLFSCCTSLYAQKSVWGINSGGNTNDRGNRMALDNAGNVYVIGTFLGDSVNFNPSPNINDTVNLWSHGDEDMFLAKYDAQFNYQWALNVGIDGLDSGWDLTVDNNSNVYVAGYFQGTYVDFNPSTGFAPVSAVGNIDGFIAKYNTNGAYQWAFNVGGNARDELFSISVMNNDLVVTGYFSSDSLDIDPSSNKRIIKNYGVGKADILVAKYDLNGNLICGFHTGSTKNDIGNAVLQLPNGDFYLTGSFEGVNIDFDPSNATLPLTSNGIEDYFLAKYNWGSIPPTGSISGSTICENEQAYLTFNATSGTGPFQLELTDGTNFFTIGNVQNNIPFLVSNNLAVTTNYTLIGLGNENQCPSTPTVPSAATIVVNTKPQGNFESTITCQTTYPQIKFNATKGLSPFTIVFAQGSQTYTVNNVLSNTLFDLPAMFDTTTTIKIKSITGANGCKRETLFTQDSIIIYIQKSPQGNFVGNVVCGLGNGYVQFNATAGLSPFYVQFTQGINTFNHYNYISGSPIMVSNNPATDTSYTLLTVTGNNGCTRSINFSQAVAKVEVNTASQAANNITASNNIICEGETVQLQINGGSLGTRAKWFLYANSCGNTKIDSTIGSTFSVKPLITTSYFIRAENICAATNCAAVSIMVNPLPKIQFTTINDVCNKDIPFYINTVSISNNVTGNSLFSGNGINATGLFNPLLAGFGSNTIKYKFVTNNGCADSALQTINVKKSPDVYAGPDIFILNGGTGNINANIVAALDSFKWSPNIYLSNPLSLQTKTNPSIDITYDLQAFASNGCSISDTLEVKILQDFKIPNAFSPNGDGINDFWTVPYLETYPFCRVNIFTRNGALVYENFGAFKSWNGTYKGKTLPVGTYYYTIEPNVGTKKYAGWLMIIK